jgi:uncharacterized damage-inducible protein DinB
MLTRYAMFAGYNAWCNERLYDATAKIEAFSSSHCTARSTTSW